MTRESLVVKLAERPTSTIIPGKTFETSTVLAPAGTDLQAGQVLLETLYLSLDPGVRIMINPMNTNTSPVQVGEIMPGPVVARVLASKSSRAKPGDIVTAMTGFCEVAIANEDQVELVTIAPNSGIQLTDFLGVLGETGMTAYFGIDDIANVRPGETVVISGAAGATGSIAGQIAKIRGARVIGIAGSEEKSRWLKSVGFDESVNYKDNKFEKRLGEVTPQGIDVFWDNVGGEILEVALARANKFSRFVMCGGVSQYNTSDPRGPRNMINVVTKRVKMQGFHLYDYQAKYEGAREKLANWLKEGKLQREVTVIRDGLQNAEQGLLDLFHGRNIGKMVVEVKVPNQD